MSALADRGALTERVQTAGHNLFVDVVTVQVLSALKAASVRSLLVKGPTVAYWLYPDRARTYNDTDVFVDPSDLTIAESTLRALGFERTGANTKPFGRAPHSTGWVRARDGALVDLHTSLPCVPMDHHHVWRIVTGSTAPLEVRGVEVETLGFPARLLLVVLHAANDGVRMPKSKTDLMHAIDGQPIDLWRQTVELARALGVEEIVGTTIAAVAGGRDLVDRLDLCVERNVELEIRRAGNPALVPGLEALARAGSLRERFRLVVAAAWPSPAVIRAGSALARRNRVGLLGAYLGRLVWLAVRAPLAVRAWLRLRRSAVAHPSIEPGIRGIEAGIGSSVPNRAERGQNS